MAFQLRIISLRARFGSIARHTGFTANRKPRHALCVRCSVQMVPPEGNGAGLADQFLDQQRGAQLPVQPRPSAFVVVFGQMAQSGERLEAPENELHLPSDAVPFQHLSGVKPGFREGREQDHEFRILEGLRLELRALIARILAQFGVRNPDGLVGLPQRAHASRHRLGGAGRDRRPGSGDARVLQGGHCRTEVETAAVRPRERQAARVDPNRCVGAGRRNVEQPRGRGVATVRNHQIAFGKRKLLEGLSRPRARRFRDPEMVTSKRRKANAVVEPPQRAGLARLLHRRRIKQPDLNAPVASQSNALLPRQGDTQRVKPPPRLPQPLHQRNIREVRQPVSGNEMLAMLDWSRQRQPWIEDSLARRHLQGGTLVLYDVTSSYLEARYCPLAGFGHNRDGKKGKKQIVFGLLCSEAGCPAAAEVFAGNPGDPATVASQVRKLRSRFGNERIALVGNRGMLTTARIREEMTDIAVSRQ